jgi:6-phosphogluconolactonase/glucosamine-6-phosphate isomerase/deaminase
MKSHISDTPDIDAGTYISQMLEVHRAEDILLLFSGGSAFAILPHIKTDLLGTHVTIGMVDERFTREEKANNFLQFQQSAFYAEAQNKGVRFFESVPKEGETHEDFAERIKVEIETYFYSNPNNYAIGVFGIGEDGHTAGIFPKPEKDFALVYKTDAFYIPITQDKLPYPWRTTITPTFIEEVIDDVVLYAVGTNKCENILDYMYNKTFTQHEIPALIPASHPQSMLFTDCPTITP